MARVKDLMTRDVLTVCEDDLVEKVASLILHHDVGGVPVVDAEQRLLGIVTEFALLEVLYQPEKKRQRVGAVMTRNVLTVCEDVTPQEVSQLLVDQRVRRVPVVRDDRLVGIVSRRDLIRFATSGYHRGTPLPKQHDSAPTKVDRAQLLLVDDSRIIHEMICDTLQPLRFEITCAVSGGGVLEMARDSAFDLILLDRVLPDIDGLTLLQQLRSDPATQHIPVIMVTSCDLATHVAEALDAGAVDYIRKPFSPMEIRARVRGALRTYRLQQDLLAAKLDAEAASTAKNEFLANVSHEIRTPMTAILGYADILQETLSNPEQLASLGTIHRNGRQLLELINDILDIAQIESGRLEVNRSVVSPTRLLEEVGRLMEGRAREKGIEFHIECGDGVPRAVVTDDKRFRQILTNLIANAIKFTDRGSVRVVAHPAASRDGRMMFDIDVIDTGAGIDAKHVERIFEPFVQADTSSTRQHSGSGLGLAISRSLAEALGGRVHVQSRLGHGSTFTLSIEAPPESLTASSTEDPRPHARDAAAPGSQERLLDGCRVLLVEDGVDNQRVISFILRKSGANVEIVENGQQAVDCLNDPEPRFDVVLMDMQMPVLDGYSATRRLRQRGYTRPILAITAHAMKYDRAKCLEAGCDDFITKPVDRGNLIQLVAQYHGRRLDPPAWTSAS